MKIGLNVRRRDVKVLISFVVITASLFGFARYDVAQKRKALDRLAETHVSAFYEGLDPSEYEHLLEVENDKVFTIFGRHWGVVRLFTRKKGDATMESFVGIAYFYERSDAEWALADTAQIQEPEFIYEGYLAFEDAGYSVDEAAYSRYDR